MSTPPPGSAERPSRLPASTAPDGKGAPPAGSTGREHNTVTAQGQGSVSIAKHVGDFFLNVLTGIDKWSLWNWVPCALVSALDMVVLLRRPEGPGRQFVLVYALLVLPWLATVWRAQYGVRWAPARRAAVSSVSLVLAVLGLLQTEYLREHGEVDVTGSVKVKQKLLSDGGDSVSEGSDSVSDGNKLVLAIGSGTVRQHLRLVMRVEDASPGTQSCVADTTFDAALEGDRPDRDNRGLRAGTAAQLDLGGQRSDVRVTVTVHTSPGCEMFLPVRQAVLYG